MTPDEIAKVAYQVGFRGAALTNAVAIALAESGGNPGARNPNGEDSRGLWQINVAPNVRPNKWGDLYDPVTNARAAFEVSGGGKNFQPWTTYSGATAHGRAASYTKHLATAQTAVKSIGENPGPYQGSSGGSVAMSNFDDDGLASDASPEEIRSWIQANAAEMAYMLDIPELMETVHQWVRDDAPLGDLTYRVRNTEFWKTTGPTARKWEQLQREDPKAAEEAFLRKAGEVERLYQTLGLKSTPEGIFDITSRALLGGQSLEETERLITDLAAFFGGEFTAPAKNTAAEMREQARKFGLPLAEGQAQDWAKNMELGRMSADVFESWLRDTAKGRWAGNDAMLKFIESGGVPEDYFSAHRSMIAETLELNPQDVDVFAPQWLSVTDTFDPDLKGRRTMTVAEARQLALKDDRVKKTAWYKQEDAQWASGVGRLLNVLPGGG